MVVALRFSDLDRLNRTLDLTRATEDAVLFTSRVSLPDCKQGLATVIWCSLVHLLLLTWDVHPIEDVCWTDSDADTVGDTDVKVGAYGGSVYAILFAYAVLPEYFVSQMLFFYLPLVRETGVIDELSDVSGNGCFSHHYLPKIESVGRGIKLLDSRIVADPSHRLLFKSTLITSAFSGGRRPSIQQGNLTQGVHVSVGNQDSRQTGKRVQPARCREKNPRLLAYNKSLPKDK